MRALPLRSADSASADAPRRAVQGADALVCKEGEMTDVRTRMRAKSFFDGFVVCAMLPTGPCACYGS